MGRFARSGAKPDASLRAELSDREREVLRQTAWGHSNREIAARMEISVKTVEVHKINAMKKLDIKGRNDIVRYAILQGWLQNS
jgi:DNA-binding CsgD family transcriptional regulator